MLGVAALGAAAAIAGLALAPGRGGLGPAAAFAAKPAAGERRLTLFYTAEVHGTVEPCGCTSDPLGDISRLATVMADAKRAGGGVALVDAGGLGYPEGAISAKERPSADLRADFLGRELERLGLIGAGLGETDLVGGVDHLGPKRLASNIAGPGTAAYLRSPTLQKIGEISVGVLGVADPALAPGINGRAIDMTTAVQRDIERLRQQGAEIVVLLAPVERTVARKLARDTGADVVVLGKRVGHGMPRSERVGRAFLVAPEDELQRVGRIDIVLRGSAPAENMAPPPPPDLADAGGEEGNRVRREEIDRTLEKIRLGLASWTGGAGGGSGARPSTATSAPAPSDAPFVAAKRREQADLEAERARLSGAWKAPATGSYAVNGLVPLRRAVKRDAAMAKRMKALDKAIAAANLAQATPPPPAEPGRASFVGMAKCVTCHRGAGDLWKHTVHAQAWKTLVEGGKQADLKCISCHVTGFGQVGGSSLGFTKNLESVQCETCHGPGSLHVAGEGEESPIAIKRAVPETVCLGCHTEQHSDTFDYKPYLRDILGPGHGGHYEEVELGPGKTGHELRSAALARAKLAATAGSTSHAAPKAALP